MAHELLRGTSDVHLYRHDVESFFYIMLTMCGHHTISGTNGAGKGAKLRVVMREGVLPYEDWYNEPSFANLGQFKHYFLLVSTPIELSPIFEDFRPWLKDLKASLSGGFISKISHNLTPPDWQLRRAGGSAGRTGPAPAPFDDETLGGHVNYSAIIEPARELEGELKGLIIRYDPTSSTSPTQAGAV